MEINPAVKHTFRDRGHGDGATTTKAIPERDLPVLFLPRKNSKPILNINLYFRCLKISKLTLLYKITETREKKNRAQTVPSHIPHRAPTQGREEGG